MVADADALLRRDEVKDVVFEPRVGGRLYEVTDEGAPEWG